MRYPQTGTPAHLASQSNDEHERVSDDMVGSYRAATQTIQDWVGQSDGIKSDYPGSIYDQDILHVLAHPPSVPKPVPLLLGTKPLAIADDIDRGTIRTLRLHMALYPGAFELIISDRYLAKMLVRQWADMELVNAPVAFHPNIRLAALSPVALACAPHFALGALKPFVAHDLSTALIAARWVPGGSVLRFHRLPSARTSRLAQPQLFVVGGKTTRLTANTLARTGFADVDAFIAAREAALNGDPYDVNVPKAASPITLEVI